MLQDNQHATEAESATQPTAQAQGHWYDELRQLHGAGLRVKKAGSLADLHRARKEHKGQFFTPDAVAQLMWRIAEPAMEKALRQSPEAKLAILDNSIGSGRLVQNAHPDKHYIIGCDVDVDLIERLESALDAARIKSDLKPIGMEWLRAGGVALAFINPPFSIHIESESLKSYPCTTWGRLGANTSTLSHAYALHQALDAAEVVLAVLPTTYAMTLVDDASVAPRLRAILKLPAETFRIEGANVSTSIVVFGNEPASMPCRVEAARLDGGAVYDFDLRCSTMNERKPWSINNHFSQSENTISGAVTGNPVVHVKKAGRYLTLGFQCAFMKARILNAIYQSRCHSTEIHRYPLGVRYTGQGALDLEAILAADDPMVAYQHLLDLIERQGGEPIADPAIAHFITRRQRRYQRERTPFGHWVKGNVGRNVLTVTVKRKRQLVRGTIGSPILKVGERFQVTPDASGAYTIEKDGRTATLQEADLNQDFQIEPSEECSQWRECYPSRTKVFPDLAKSIRARARQSGADKVASWDYQLEDLVELRMSRGAIAGWTMGCGKSRLAIALCMMGGDHNAIVVEPHLIGEFVDQLRETGIPEDQWQVIRSVEQCGDLRRINLITFNRLRMPICEGAGRRTYARVLRRRFSTVTVDECHALRNHDTAQTQAVYMLSPRRRYGMTGTPIANYVQDILPLLAWASGDGTVLQPYGKHHPFMRTCNARTLVNVPRGVQEFQDTYTVFEWVTAEFEDGLRKGAKRQVPKIRNINRLRDWAAPMLKRRCADEPMVKAHFNVPSATIRTVDVEWDDAHLSHYWRVATEFANWYKRAKDAAGEKGRAINLISLLARIQAVINACNDPATVSDKSVVPAYCKPTSKHRAIIERCVELTEQGHKTIVYVDGPALAERLARAIRGRGIQTVVLHGQQPIIARTKSLNEEFRFGPAPVLVASVGVSQTGLNLWQADRALFAVRSWTATQERQCIARLLRPQQKRDVEIEFYNLVGSIDDYQDQMTRMKQSATESAIDFLTPEAGDDVEFKHLDRILNEFVANLAESQGMSTNDLRKRLSA